MNDITTNLLITDLIVFSIYSISIGFAEEFSIRGFFQSHLIKYYGTTKKTVFLSVLISSLFFGFIHFINFDSGIYGELAQVCYSTFIGFMFGALLLVTKRIYPLIIIHALFDFIMDLDTVGIPILKKTNEIIPIENAAISTLLLLPCFIYGSYVLWKKYDYDCKS